MRLLGGVLACLVAMSAAHADELSKAREHYRNATRAYELGSYDEAIREYGEAYRLKDDPAILYNMAQAHRLAEHHAEALRLYRMFLIKVPDAQNHDEVVAKIDALQKLIDDQKKAKALPPDTTMAPGPRPSSPPAQTAPPPPPHPVAADVPQDRHSGRPKQIAGLAVGIVGMAAAAAGIGLAVVASKTADDLTRANQAGQPFDRAKYDAGKAEGTAGPVLIGVGAAAAVAGVIVGVIGLRESRRRAVALLPSVSPGAVGATLGSAW